MSKFWNIFKAGAKGTATSIPAVILAGAGAVVTAKQAGIPIPDKYVAIAAGVASIAGALGLNNAAVAQHETKPVVPNIPKK